jgi:hypothetical protein
MRIVWITLAMVFLGSGVSFGQVDKLLKKGQQVIGGGSLSQEEAGRGLKEALNKGVEQAVGALSATDGYLKSPYKILMPKEAQQVADKLRNVPGFSNLESELTTRMNRAAELAAAKARPIFLSAIRQMTFQDALNILTGEPNAATQYLKRTTSTALYSEFKPVIAQSLDEVKAREYWRNAVGAYNKIPLVQQTNPELDDHVTQKALEGLFSLVEQKEKGIRSDVSQRDSELLKKVFSRQDKR